MQHHRVLLFSAFALVSPAMFGCGAGLTNVNSAKSNTTTSNSVANGVNATNVNTAAAVEAREPEQYQATVTLKLEAVGSQQQTALPTVSATVARNSVDRRMEFEMPAGGRIVFLDKGGINYLILPDKKQYAELNRESLGFDTRRMLMPEHIVQAVKGVRGLERVGEEKYNGRDVVKYRYASVADTRSQAGQVATESFLLVDKETGLPLRSETVSQSQSGSVQGYSGLRVITEITDLKTDVPAGLFDLPTDLQKVDPSKVRSQVDTIFNALTALLTQIMQQTPNLANTAGTPTR